MADLTEIEKSMLDTMDRWRVSGGSLVNEITTVFHMRQITFFQTLAALIDRPEALAYKPLLVNRLRRLQQRRGRAAVMRARARRGQESC